MVVSFIVVSSVSIDFSNGPDCFKPSVPFIYSRDVLSVSGSFGRNKRRRVVGAVWSEPAVADGRIRIECSPISRLVRAAGNPMDSAPGDVTLLLAELTEGNERAASPLIPLVYDELRQLAGRYMRRERSDRTLQATALVHEAYLKLGEQRSADWQSRAHFLRIAAQFMRRILIDHARGHLRDKRGGGQEAVPLDEAFVFSPAQSYEWLKLDESLHRLGASIRGRARLSNCVSSAG